MSVRKLTDFMLMGRLRLRLTLASLMVDPLVVNGFFSSC